MSSGPPDAPDPPTLVDSEPAPIASAPDEFELLTAVGPAAIAVLSVRGAGVLRFVRRHLRTPKDGPVEPPREGLVRRARLVDADGEFVDDLVVTSHAPPPRFDLRLCPHGSAGVIERVRELLASAGFRERGAAVAGSDLWYAPTPIAAEAYALLPAMRTLAGARWLLRQATVFADFVEKVQTQGPSEASRRAIREALARADIVRWFSEPLRVALIGPPNAGKSTLANALSDQAVSLVSGEPGTTRDCIEAPGEIDGFPVLWIDTAGVREAADELEAESIRRTRALAAACDVIVVVLDATAPRPARESFLSGVSDLRTAAIVLNKRDLIRPDAPSGVAALPPRWRESAVEASALERRGLEALSASVLRGAGRSGRRLDLACPFTPRQVELLRRLLGDGRVV